MQLFSYQQINLNPKILWKPFKSWYIEAILIFIWNVQYPSGQDYAILWGLTSTLFTKPEKFNNFTITQIEGKVYREI